MCVFLLILRKFPCQKDIYLGAYQTSVLKKEAF